MNKADFERNRRTIEAMILNVHQPNKLSIAQHNAITNAVMLMTAQKADKHLIAVLSYHIDKPEAILFRDVYTMRALRAAFNALTRKIEALERWGE